MKTMQFLTYGNTCSLTKMLKIDKLFQVVQNDHERNIL